MLIGGCWLVERYTASNNYGLMTITLQEAFRMMGNLSEIPLFANLTNSLTVASFAPLPAPRTALPSAIKVSYLKFTSASFAYFSTFWKILHVSANSDITLDPCSKLTLPIQCINALLLENLKHFDCWIIQFFRIHMLLNFREGVKQCPGISLPINRIQTVCNQMPCGPIR